MISILNLIPSSWCTQVYILSYVCAVHALGTVLQGKVTRLIDLTQDLLMLKFKGLGSK